MDSIKKLLEVMARLRDAQHGCEWDLQQNFASVAPYTVEEAYEVADAIECNDMAALQDELGDLLFQVVFHAQMAAEKNLFDFDDVANGIVEKMLRRHPHVFGDEAQRAQGAQAGDWEKIKASERDAIDDQSAMAGVAKALPALKRAEKLGKRASAVGFDWPDRRGVREKIHEELDELEAAVGARQDDETKEEFGDLLFAVVNMARHLGVAPEQALTGANYKFERRFRDMEQDIVSNGQSMKDLTLATLDKHWRAAKKRVG